MLFQTTPTPITYLDTVNGKKIYMKQDYLNHLTVSGNKLRKLKYNLLSAQQSGATLISFGGAYSNHIAALASAGNVLNLPTVGIIRGQELTDKYRWGHTLKTASDNGMQLHFVSRSVYREKALIHQAPHPEIQAIINQYPNAMVIPEGGSNQLSVLGSAEIIAECEQQGNLGYNTTLFCACGTGGTLAGLIDGVAKQTPITQYNLIGIPVLKGHRGLSDDICQLSQHHQTVNWQLNHNYHFGGYAKTTEELREFIHDFENNYQIPIDPVYTAKLCYAVFDLAEKSTDNESEDWLIYHSGGLQGKGA